tara:strand:+ start:427 stop:1032 length:606 start_codon:yes stop_codon:yes gene_type:complete
MSKILPTESLDELFSKIVESSSWEQAQLEFNECDIIYIIGNGGNLAVADHGSVDITRLSKKLAIAPGSGILATSIIGDNSIDTWFSNWLEAHTTHQPSEVNQKSMLIGVSSSGTANNICSCLSYANSLGMKTLMISGRYLPQDKKNTEYNYVEIGTDFYHTGEVMSLMLFYQLVYGSGCECPSISKKINAPSFDRLVNSVE